MLKLLCLTLIIVVVHGLNEELIMNLNAAAKKTENTLKSILDEWHVKDYPGFLKSCFMHKASWELMKFKFMQKILSASLSKRKQSFIASFTGRFKQSIHCVSSVYVLLSICCEILVQ